MSGNGNVPATALTLTSPAAPAHQEPAPSTAVAPWKTDLELCEELIQSDLLPRSVNSASDALVILLCGRELGLQPMQALRSIHVVEGKPTLSADLMAGLIRRSGLCAELRCTASDTEKATFVARRKGQAKATTLTFRIEEAKRAGLTRKTNWKRYPAAMLRARALAAICRLVWPDVLAGIYDPEELGAADETEDSPELEISVESPDGSEAESEDPDSTEDNPDPDSRLTAEALKDVYTTAKDAGISRSALKKRTKDSFGVVPQYLTNGQARELVSRISS